MNLPAHTSVQNPPVGATLIPLTLSRSACVVARDVMEAVRGEIIWLHDADDLNP